MGDGRAERDEQVRRDTDVAIRRVCRFVLRWLFILLVFIPFWGGLFYGLLAPHL